MKYLSIALLGGLIGVLCCNWHYFDFDKNFKWTDLFTVAVTSFIGLHIAGKLTERQSALRGEKDFLIGEIQEFKQELLKLKSKNDAGSISFNEAKTLFRDMNHDILHLQELSQFSDFCKNIDFSNLRNEFSSVRKLITDISPVNDMISIPTDIKNLTDTGLDNIKKHLYVLILKINASKE